MSRDCQNTNMAAEPVDPTAPPSALAMASRDVSPLAQETHDVELTLSDDSFVQSPQATGGGKRTREAKSRPGSRRRMAMTIPRAASASASRGMQRPPSPALGPQALPEHRSFSATDGTIEARLAALEMQQSSDHLQFERFREQMQAVSTSSTTTGRSSGTYSVAATNTSRADSSSAARCTRSGTAWT